MPVTKNFTGEFEPAGTVTGAEEEGVSEKGDANGNEAKVMKLIKDDEGDGIYYDDLAIKISSEGVDNPMLDEILDSLTDQGLIFQPRFNHYKEA